MDEWFAVYVVRGEGFLCQVDNLVTHRVMKCGHEPSVSPAKSLIYGNGMRATIAFILNVMGDNIVRRTQNHKIPWSIVLYRLP